MLAGLVYGSIDKGIIGPIGAWGWAVKGSVGRALCMEVPGFGLWWGP